MRKIFSLVLLVVLAVGGLAFGQPAAAQGSAWVRVVNTAPDSQGMNVFLNNALAARGVLPGNAFGYFEVPAGKQQISFRRGSQIIANAVADLELAGGDYVTVVAVNKLAELAALVLRDDASPVTRGLVRVRVVHTGVGAPNVDVLGPDGKPLFTNVGFGTASEYALLLAGPATFTVTPAGDAATAVVTLKDLNLSREKRYDIFIVGEGQGLRASVAQANTLKASGTNQVRFGHFLAGAGPLDVLLNAEDAFNNVQERDVTYALVIAPGDYKVDIFPAGKRDTVLVSTTLSLKEDQSVLLAVSAAAGGIVLDAIDEDYKPMRVGQGRVQFVNLNAGGPNASLQYADGTPLVSNLAYMATGSVDTSSGNVTVRAVDQEGKFLAERELAIPSNSGSVFVLWDDDPEAPGLLMAAYTYAVQPVVPVRFVHASTVAGPVDVYIDGVKVLAKWAKGSSTDYVNMMPGAHELALYLPDSDPAATEPLLRRNIDLGLAALTAVAFDQNGAPTVLLHVDNLQSLAPGRARVRLIQASADVGTVRWFNAVDKTPLSADPIGAGDSSSAVDLPAGSYTFQVSSVSDTNIVLRLPSVDLKSGSLVTFIVTGPGVADVLTLIYQIAPGQ